MIIRTKQVESVLGNRAVSAYHISKETGVSQSAISRYRSGERPFENLTMETIMKIQKWIDEGNYTFSYDYSELIHEIQSNLAEGLFDGDMYVVRGDYREEIDCRPIVDYYYRADEIEEGDLAERVSPEKVLEEMQRFNSIF